jgi:hypothetical protein
MWALSCPHSWPRKAGRGLPVWSKFEPIYLNSVYL